MSPAYRIIKLIDTCDMIHSSVYAQVISLRVTVHVSEVVR